MRSDGSGNRIHGAQDLLGHFRITDFVTETLLNRDDELQGIHGIETKTVRTHQRRVVTDLADFNFQHQIINQH